MQSGLSFGSVEVCQVARLTPRQLQWWDEHDIISPAQHNRRRLYRAPDVIAVMTILQLRRKGMSLQKIRAIVRPLRRQVERRLHELLAGELDLYLLTDGQTSYFADQPGRIVELLKASPRPLILVPLTELAERLAAFQQQRARRRIESERENQMSLF